MKPGKTTELGGEFAQTKGNTRAPDRFLYYRDVAILRFYEKPTKVLCENEFTSTFLKRQNSNIWKEIMVTQTNVKSKIGIGRLLTIKFFAPISSKDTKSAIKYDFERMGDDYDLKEEEFCHKQLLIVCDYVQKVHGYQILQMQAEFTVDDDGQVWFLFANNIMISK